MLKLKNYNSSIFLNTDNFISNKIESKFNKKFNKVLINYVFTKRIKIIRTFVYFYSIFLISTPFNSLEYHTNLEFKLNIYQQCLLILDIDYDSFYYSQ